MLIQGKILSVKDDLTEIRSIRNKVFIEELMIPYEIEFDERDSLAMHVIVYEEAGNKKAVATGRVNYDGVTCEIGHIAVLKEYRNRKYGDFTVRMLLNRAFTSGIKEVECIAPVLLKEFFYKIGFQLTRDEFVNNGILCNKMLVKQEDIITSCRKKG